jgi:hypothetical protein
MNVGSRKTEGLFAFVIAANLLDGRVRKGCRHALRQGGCVIESSNQSGALDSRWSELVKAGS